MRLFGRRLSADLGLVAPLGLGTVVAFPMVNMIRDVLGWCAIINMGLLLGWFLAFTLAHDWMYRLHGKWFTLSVEQNDTINYSGMAVFKIGIWLLNLAPYLALRTVD